MVAHQDYLGQGLLLGPKSRIYDMKLGAAQSREQLSTQGKVRGSSGSARERVLGSTPFRSQLPFPKLFRIPTRCGGADKMHCCVTETNKQLSGGQVFV
jgi:hypothetical protein